jgi:hypothetical protein
MSVSKLFLLFIFFLFEYLVLIISVLYLHTYIFCEHCSSFIQNRIVCEMVSVLAWRVIDRWYEDWSGQTKDYKNGISCLIAKYASLKSKDNDWLTQNQDNVSQWSDMSTNELLFQCATTIKLQQNLLV